MADLRRGSGQTFQMRCSETKKSRVGTVYGLSGVRNATRSFHVWTRNPLQDPTDVLNAGRGKEVFTNRDVTGTVDPANPKDPTFAPLNSRHPWYSWLICIDHRITSAQTTMKYIVEAIYGVPEVITLPPGSIRGGSRWHISGRGAGESLPIIREIYPGADAVGDLSESEWLAIAKPDGTDTGGPRIMGQRRFVKATEGPDGTPTDKLFYASFLDEKGVEKEIKLRDTRTRIERPVNGPRPMWSFVCWRIHERLTTTQLIEAGDFIEATNSDEFSIRNVDGSKWSFGPAGHVKLALIDFTPLPNDTVTSGQVLQHKVTLTLQVSRLGFTPINEVQRYEDPTLKGASTVFAKVGTELEPVVDKMRVKSVLDFNNLFSLLG